MDSKEDKLSPELVLTVPCPPQPPIVPKVSHEGDTSNFDVYPEDDWKKDPPVPQKDLEIFKNFWSLSLLLFIDGNTLSDTLTYCWVTVTGTVMEKILIYQSVGGGVVTFYL